MRDFARRKDHGTVSAVVAGVLLALMLSPAPATAQSDTQTAAVDHVSTLYGVASGLRATGNSMLGTPVVAGQFFDMPGLDTLADVNVAGVDILTGGAAGGPIDDTQFRLAADQPVDGTVAVEAAVLSGGSVNIIKLTLTPVNAETWRVTDVAGDGWTLLDRLGTATAENPDTEGDSGGSLFARAEETSETSETELDTDALIAADAAASAAQPAALSLPFTDPFDGTDLADHWDLRGADTQSYLVSESSMLVLATGGDDGIGNPESANLLVLDQPLPAGDVVASLHARLEAKTGWDVMTMAFYGGPDDYIAAQLYFTTAGCGPSLFLGIENMRPISVPAESVATNFATPLFSGPFVATVCSSTPGGRAYGDAITAQMAETGFTLRLIREGQRYWAEVEMDLPVAEGFQGGLRTARTQPVARFETPGPIALMTGQFSRAGNGETVGYFDTLDIVALP